MRGLRLPFGVGEGQVDVATLQPLQQVPCVADGEAQSNTRVVPGHLSHQIWREELGHAGQNAHVHDALDGPRGGLDFNSGALDLVEDASRVGQQGSACIGERHAAAAADEQGRPQCFLEKLELAGDRRLHQVQARRSAGHTARVGDGDKGAKLLEVHGGGVLLEAYQRLFARPALRLLARAGVAAPVWQPWLRNEHARI